METNSGGWNCLTGPEGKLHILIISKQKLQDGRAGLGALDLSEKWIDFLPETRACLGTCVQRGFGTQESPSQLLLKGFVRSTSQKSEGWGPRAAVLSPSAGGQEEHSPSHHLRSACSCSSCVRWPSSLRLT